jgi:hypothetical protein
MKSKPSQTRVANAFLKRTRIEPALREKINDALDRAGFGGGRKFLTVGAALSSAFSVLGKFGIEMDTVLNSWFFRKKEGTMSIELAFTNEEDSFAPQSISENLLFFQWAELIEDRFEVIAYVS